MKRGVIPFCRPYLTANFNAASTLVPALPVPARLTSSRKADWSTWTLSKASWARRCLVLVGSSIKVGWSKNSAWCSKRSPQNFQNFSEAVFGSLVLIKIEETARAAWWTKVEEWCHGCGICYQKKSEVIQSIFFSRWSKKSGEKAICFRSRLTRMMRETWSDRLCWERRGMRCWLMDLKILAENGQTKSR